MLKIAISLSQIKESQKNPQKKPSELNGTKIKLKLSN